MAQGSNREHAGYWLLTTDYSVFMLATGYWLLTLLFSCLLPFLHLSSLLPSST